MVTHIPLPGVPESGGRMKIIKITHGPMTVAIIVLLMFFMQTPLQAVHERRGSTVVVTLTDGSQVEGELLAVKEDALLVYDPVADQGKTIELQQVANVKVLKKSNLLKGLFVGLAVGLALSEYSYKIAGNDESLESIIYIFLPPPITLGGVIFGALTSISKTVRLSRDSIESVRGKLEWLKLHSREWAATLPQRQIWNRFHLLWSPSRQNISVKGIFYGKGGTFRFVDDVPSTDTAVYPSKFEAYLYKYVRVDQFRLEYELTPHFSSSLEFIASGRFNSYLRLFNNYFSTDYGNEYESENWIHKEYSYTSLLLGLNWRPIPLSITDEHIIDLGIAAGPAQVNLISYTIQTDLIRTPLGDFRDLTWICKAHAAYDYAITHNFLIGVFFGYQYLRASFPGLTFINEKQKFSPPGHNTDPSVIHSIRRTEFTIPGHGIQLDGMTYGFRVGLRF
jgi:hypothetical protein